MRPEAHIASCGTAYPPLVDTDRIIAVCSEEYRAAGKPETLILKFADLCKKSKIKTRPMCLAKYHEGQATADVQHLGKAAATFWPDEVDASNEGRDLKGEERHALWQAIAPKLALEAAKKALDGWSGTAADITHVVTTNTSGWVEPGLACHIIHGLGLSLDTQKSELNFNGCFCGMTCLRLARDIVRAGDDSERRAVLVVGLELTSLHRSPHAEDIDTLVSHSLFSDGAAAIIVATEGSWLFQDAGMSLIPDSEDLLGLSPYPPPSETQYNGSFRMQLSSKVPEAIFKYFSDGNGKDLVKKVVDKNFNGFPELAVHPGGPKILDVLGGALSKNFNLDSSALKYSFDTLFEYGNLGSTAILFVLTKVQACTSKNEIMSLAFGPGVTVEWGAFRRVRIHA